MRPVTTLLSAAAASTLVSLGLAMASQTPAATPETISLAGTWRFALDPEDVGVDEQWFDRALADRIHLPGTTDENHKGTLNDERRTDRLSRVWYWKGPAWYQRRVTIPDAWRGRRITLLLERSKHTLTVLVDNARLPPVGPSHAVEERTQTNWNGIVGRLEIRATAPVWLEDVQVHPGVEKNRALLRAVIGNVTGEAASGRITVRCESHNVAAPSTFEMQSFEAEATGRESVALLTYDPGGEMPRWDEFQPALLRATLELEVEAGGVRYRDQRSVDFGLREFTRERNRLVINGRKVFLRGKNDCCFFPLTGYPPMDKAGWLQVLSIARSWGLNHYRFHSWCPPEAAFQAADELGVYFQVELPNKRSGFEVPESEEAATHDIDRLDVESGSSERTLYEYARREGELIFEAFGNHPSFVMFTLGNELGRNEAMFELVAHFKELDPRRLHAQGTNNVHWNPHLAEGDDFWVTGKTAETPPLRGSFSTLDFPDPHIEHRPPSTMVDYRESIEGVPVPAIGHETGQFQVYPDYRDIAEFTGVVRARNYGIFRERLEAAGMLDLAHEFVRASGALSAICYREDIEAALRTPGLGGFQLLDLQDFPGQGPALVGMLNVFMESKGVITPGEWRQFCSETVPLLRMEKYVWTTDETFEGRVQVAHHGPVDLIDARVTATVTGGEDRSVVFPSTTLERGGLVEIGELSFPLDSMRIAAPRKLTVTLAIEGTAFRNSYPIWIYPPEVDTDVPDGVLMTDRFCAPRTQEHLAAGGKVLLLPKLDRLPHSIEGAFQTEFWSPMFGQAAKRRGVKPPPGTLGLLCDPATPALAAFPTEFHSNWQWWHLLKRSRPIILDDTPRDYRPTVQVIDNFMRNHKLGLIAETRVGEGALLFCAIDLLGQPEQPAARQLLHSLLQYLDSPAFAPRSELDVDLLKRLFPDDD